MADPASKHDAQQTVEMHYIKGTQFRTIHTDGVYGGVTPHGLLAMCVFAERQAIPRLEVYGFQRDGLLGEALAREGRSGYVRELEATIMMNRHVALSVADWLRTKVSELDEFEAKQAARASDAS